MKHIIITMFRYDDEDKFKKRLEVMKNTIVKSLYSQTNQNFTWVVMCRPQHREEISKIYKNNIILVNDSNDFRKLNEEENFTIQTRHDSDDLMCPQYIQLIQDQYNLNKKLTEPFLIEFQPTLNQYSTNNFYEFRLDYKKMNSTSCFITLCPQGGDKTIWDHPHGKWVDNVKHIIRHPNRLCVSATVHGNNTTTGMTLAKGKIPPPFDINGTQKKLSSTVIPDKGVKKPVDLLSVIRSVRRR